MNGVDTLLKLNVGKVMLCAFPYSNSLSHSKNKHIGVLNSTLHQLTCCHSDKLLFFDTNKFISDFKLTEKGMYLSIRQRQTIAILIAFNINIVINNITITSCRDESVLSRQPNSTMINFNCNNITLTNNTSLN